MALSSRLRNLLGIALADKAGAVELVTAVDAAANGTPTAPSAAVAAITVTATTGVLPTANGTVTVADAATPTVVELLDYCTELKAKVAAINAVLLAQGLTQ
ncbi:hypothetical protein SAMN05444166_4245 [Singulisphaera sp. GP187]|uniref:hypothetical protein n=1 Tax=Singulisphaera sp. GP187 TaxID=1882752 RepID=UPI0009270C56|nr:hypothetical protein [Singulisphaera sp. GP187]SIO38154.1 hypothetical protein SAMN05444166_4245 [Singulisphaera sp. GP187]